MRHSSKSILFVCAAVAASAIASSAGAATMVVGSGLGRACYEAAKSLEIRGSANVRDIALCNRALSEDPLTIRDRAATHVNRGVMYMTRKDYRSALNDIDSAMNLWPMNGEAYVNQGAIMIALSRFQEGVAAINKGLELKTNEPEKAYLNRAFGRELLGDVRGAYADFQKAAEIKPDWVLPRQELTRFSFRSASDG